jgi:hypothetical protein
VFHVFRLVCITCPQARHSLVVILRRHLGMSPIDHSYWEVERTSKKVAGLRDWRDKCTVTVKVRVWRTMIDVKYGTMLYLQASQLLLGRSSVLYRYHSPGIAIVPNRFELVLVRRLGGIHYWTRVIIENDISIISSVLLDLCSRCVWHIFDFARK